MQKNITFRVESDNSEDDITLMLTMKQTDVQLECKARVDSLCLILVQALTGS